MSQVTIIRTVGTVEDYERKQKGSALINWINQTIKAECGDAVNLRDGRVMIVNDRGYEVETIEAPGHITLKPTKALLPLNVKATELIPFRLPTWNHASDCRRCRYRVG